MDKWIEEMLERSERLAGELQPWSEYFRLRAIELDLLLSMHRMKIGGRVLEIGCGNGFVSAILSGLADEVIATDLAGFDAKTHSVGISRAKGLFKRLDIKNARGVSCSGQTLPFKDRSFDAVFCLYTLEHLKDRDLAMREIGRVLKSDSTVVFLVPGFMERALYPFVYYSEIVMKAARLLFESVEKAIRTRVAANEADIQPSGDQELGIRKSGYPGQWRKFRHSYAYFPAPDPHGEYPGYFVELAETLPFTWLGLARRNRLRVDALFTTMLFPKAFASIFLGGRSLGLYAKTVRLNNVIGRWPFIKYFGQNLCLVFKNDAD